MQGKLPLLGVRIRVIISAIPKIVTFLREGGCESSITYERWHPRVIVQYNLWIQKDLGNETFIWTGKFW